MLSFWAKRRILERELPGENLLFTIRNKNVDEYLYACDENMGRAWNMWTRVPVTVCEAVEIAAIEDVVDGVFIGEER